MLTERVSPERLEYELDKLDDPRDPPVPDITWRHAGGEDDPPQPLH